MAIQLRRGAYADFDPQKMKPAEVAVVRSGDPSSTDGKAVYVAISAGDVKRMASFDEIEDEVANQIDPAVASATQAAVASATANVNAAVTAAEDAADRAEAAAEQAEGAIEVDDTLSVEGRAADAKAVGDFKSATEELLGGTEVIEQSYNLIDGKTIQVTSIIKIIDASNQSITDFIPVEYGQTVIAVKTGTSTLGNGAFFDENQNGIAGTGLNVAVNGVENRYSVPENAAYVVFSGITARMAGLTVSIESTTQGTIPQELSEKLDTYQGQANAGKILTVGSDGNVILENQKAAGGDSEYEKIIPLFASMFPDFFWVSNNEIAAFSAGLSKYKDGTVSADNNAWFQISGSEGDSFVTVISGGNGDVSDITTAEKEKPFGCVIMYDDGRYYPCNAKYLTDTTFSVYPPLKADIEAGELAQIKTGIHLSRRGYRAYSQFLYNIEPKYCEKELYLAKWRNTDASVPFTYYGVSAYNVWGVYQSNISNDYIDSIFQKKYRIGRASTHPASQTESGITWDVEIGNNYGYVEFYLGMTAGNDGYTVSSESAVHCELWCDGVKKAEYIKTSKICERVCLDFVPCESATLKIYCSDWQYDSQVIDINHITWWINRKYKTTGEKLFPTGAVVAQLFDSWGVFDDAESAVYLQKEINADAGITVPFFNGSLSNQTSAWGKAWFYNKVFENNPSIVITDFGINDVISYETNNLPSTITGGDGITYDNKVSQDEYNENMAVICNAARNNKIIPIVVGVALSRSTTYVKGFIDHMAKENE